MDTHSNLSSLSSLSNSSSLSILSSSSSSSSLSNLSSLSSSSSLSNLLNLSSLSSLLNLSGLSSSPSHSQGLNRNPFYHFVKFITLHQFWRLTPYSKSIKEIGLQV